MKIPDNLNKPMLKEIWGKIYREQSNCFVGITGKVNTGKSETAGRIAHEFNGDAFEMEKYIVYTVDDLIDTALSVVSVKGEPLDMRKIDEMSLDEVEEWLMGNIDHITIKPGVTIVFDEAGTEVYIREFLSKDNKTMSKLIQIWRFLRLIVIIVVPENMNILESTVSRFLDFEIKMLGVNKGMGTARMICYRYNGWNQMKSAPYKERLVGCKSVGYIYFSHWGRALSARYSKVSHIKKVRAIVGFKKGKEKVGKDKNEPNAVCKKCKYEWYTISKAFHPACPSCGGRSTTTLNVDVDNDK